MATERKAVDSVSMKSKSPVPAAKKDDLEDVAWALSTAEAMWTRGDHGEALKWIRRAAEAASEAEEDDRALELAKAAADVAQLMSERPNAHHVAPAAHIPVAPPAPIITTPSRPPPGITPRAPAAAPTAPKVATVPGLPRPGQRSPTPPRVAPTSTKKGGRRSSPSFTDEITTEQPRPAGKGRISVTSETKRRGRNSRPAPEETVQVSATTEEIEAWPTASLVGDDFDDDQHTRIGTPAYTETAQRTSATPPPLPTVPLKMSQAVRVVVWRAADGVHVAPAGTTVSAIGVEAILVALDPSADLAAWLSGK